MKQIPVFVAGARGLLAGEFLRLLATHPYLSLAGASSRGGEGSLADAHPHLAGAERLCPGAPLLPHEQLAPRLEEALAKGPAALLLAMNHGETAPLWETLRTSLGAKTERLTVVDLSADFRLPPAGAEWHYGLPELHALPPRAPRIAAAGCFATAMQLAIVPAARAGVLDPARPMIVHGVTGSSGSGAQARPATHHPHRHDNLWAYAWEGHRHEAEVLATRNFPDRTPPLHFTACSGPFSRGIHLSAALPLADPLSSKSAYELYAEAFAGAACVRVLASGTPQLRAVTGSNRADLAAGVRGEILHVFITLDNLVKGGAGQGMQCLNLALSLPELSGLTVAGLGS